MHYILILSYDIGELNYQIPRVLYGEHGYHMVTRYQMQILSSYEANPGKLFPDNRKRHASGTPSAPPKRTDACATPPPAATTKENLGAAKKRRLRGQKKAKRGPRSDEALRKRGFVMVYVTNREGDKFAYEQWKEVENGIIDRFFTMSPNHTTFPGAKGYPRLARMAFNGGSHFIACADEVSANWTRTTVADILKGIGAGTPKFDDRGRHEGRTPYCVVLPDRVEKFGPEKTADLILRQNGWPGTARPLRGFVKPSGEGDNRPIVLLYFTVDKEAEEAMVLEGLQGYLGGGEIRLKRKGRKEDGSVPVDPGMDIGGEDNEDDTPRASSSAKPTSTTNTTTTTTTTST